MPDNQLLPFRVLKNFSETDPGGRVYHFVTGMTYIVRPGDHWMATQSVFWEQDGKVTFKVPVPWWNKP